MDQDEKRAVVVTCPFALGTEVVILAAWFLLMAVGDELAFLVTYRHYTIQYIYMHQVPRYI